MLSRRQHASCRILAGLHPMLPNLLPRVGAGRLPNMFYNTCPGHLGRTLSATTAHLVGDVIEAACAGQAAKSFSACAPAASENFPLALLKK